MFLANPRRSATNLCGGGNGGQVNAMLVRGEIVDHNGVRQKHRRGSRMGVGC